jgi:hypothetical protein
LFRVLGKYTGPGNVTVAKFVPFEPEVFVTVGTESVRLWRCKVLYRTALLTPL